MRVAANIVDSSSREEVSGYRRMQTPHMVWPSRDLPIVNEHDSGTGMHIRGGKGKDSQ